MAPHVLLCLADAKLRSLFSLLLADAGALVTVCASIDEARQTSAGRGCALCVFALEDPSEGAEAVRSLRAAAPEAALLLLAPREEADAVVALFRHGLSDALFQPIHPKRAVAALQSWLGAGAGGARTPAAGAPPAAEVDAYRPTHVVARSPAMRKAVEALWAARDDPIGVILRGEAGVEFELAARDYPCLAGEPGGGLLVLNGADLDADTLATQLALDRLHEGVGRTYYVADVDKVAREQQDALLEWLRRARRQREREKPLRLVFSAVTPEDGGVDGEFLEALQFVAPAVVRLPSLAERRGDAVAIARRVLDDLTAIHPEYRPRSFHPSALQWIAARPWKGNHAELVATVRTAVRTCPHRELTPGHFGRAAAPDTDEVAAGRVLEAARRAADR